jgi:hypothetical protein
VEVTTKHSYEIDYKYIWECSGCGMEYKRHSKSIDVAKHRCGKCKDHLVQTKPAVRKMKVTDYQTFMKENMQRLKKENPKESHSSIMKMVGELYRAQKAKVPEIMSPVSMEDLVEGLGAVSLDE